MQIFKSTLSLVLVAVCSVAGAADVATLKGKFVVDGKAPEAKPIKADKDNCQTHNLVEEKVTVGEGGTLAGVFVYLRTKDIAAADSYKDAPKEVVLDNKNCRFEPHTVVLTTSQKLVIKNSDPFGHNSKIDTTKNPAENVLIPAGGSSEKAFKQEEGLPTQVGCNIHPWMGAWVLIRANPYAAVTDKSGEFEIKDLPAGKELEFQFWHEAAGFVKDVKFAGGKADTKGRFKLTLKGDMDLGDIKIPVAALTK